MRAAGRSDKRSFSLYCLMGKNAENGKRISSDKGSLRFMRKKEHPRIVISSESEKSFSFAMDQEK